MKHALVRLAIGITEAFIALTAIACGVLMLVGSYQNGILIEAGGRKPMHVVDPTAIALLRSSQHV